MMVGFYIERINGTVSEHSMADPIAVIAAAMPDGLLRVRSAGFEPCRSLAVYPNKLTILEPSRTSRQGQ